MRETKRFQFAAGIMLALMFALGGLSYATDVKLATSDDQLRAAVRRCQEETDRWARKSNKRKAQNDFWYCRCRHNPSVYYYVCSGAYSVPDKGDATGLVLLFAMGEDDVETVAKKKCGGWSGKPRHVQLSYPRKRR